MMLFAAGRAALVGALAVLLCWGAAAGETISIEVDGGALYGTLQLPEHPHAAVLIIAGSGPTDRDGNVAGVPGKNNSLRYLAEALSQKGIASLRFDKRSQTHRHCSAHCSARLCSPT